MSELVHILQKVQRFSVNTLERLIKDNEKNMRFVTGSDIDNVHHLLEIIRDTEKLKDYFKEETNGG